MKRFALHAAICVAVAVIASLPLGSLYLLENGPEWISALESKTIGGVTEPRHKGTAAVIGSAVAVAGAMLVAICVCCVKLEDKE